MAEPPDDSLEPIDRLRAIVRILRGPGGCPWDIEQTQKSLIPNILEEAYEAADAIRSGNKNNVIEELGDLLLQVVMQSEIASESDDFFLEDVANAISDKLIRRHPHVFGDDQLNDTESVLNRWEEIKRSEKGNQKKYILDGVTNGLPSLIKAHEIQKKVEKVGFDWPEARSVIPKIREELDEVEEAINEGGANQQNENLAEEIGDLLFAVTNLTRKIGMDSESLLAAANQKFINRFNEVEKILEKQGTNVVEADIQCMEKAWEKVKNKDS
ncbi:MAG: nucleoside triphosphate pyrophosphohydrolase [Verrucomicrobiales bacterium]|nr:nucleoside triphosphate pyrophosphohydrolase [Verrucomicrobiales bacterium]